MKEIKEFIETLRTKNTKEIYKQSLDKFFQCLKTTPKNYFKNGRNYQEDIKKYIDFIKNYAPITQKTYICGLKAYLEYNNIELSNKFWKKEVKNKLPRSYALTLDDKPSIEQMKRILSYGDLKAKALFTTLASSGMRVSEVLQITPKHIDFNSTPNVITLESNMTKGNRPRRVFISSEATNLLQEWLNGGRERYLRELEMYMTGIHKVDRSDNRVFPMGTSAVRLLWKRLLIKAGLNKKTIETGRYELHPHSLRKFFISQMKTEIPEVIVEALAGHNKYLDEAYRRYSLDELKNYYLKGQSKLLIFETQPDLTETTREIEQLKRDKQEMLETINEMKAQIMELRLEKLEKINGIKKS